MASKLKFTGTTTDKLTIKGGELSDDCTIISYTDENDVVQDVEVSTLLSAFKGETIDFSVALKTDEELEVKSSDEDNE